MYAGAERLTGCSREFEVEEPGVALNEQVRDIVEDLSIERERRAAATPEGAVGRTERVSDGLAAHRPGYIAQLGKP